MEKRLQSRIQQWLNDRGISDDVINEYQLDFKDWNIVIPVHDTNGDVKFNKYRRDPEVAEGPKYRYDKGASLSLYGLKTYRPDAPFTVVCEGELDCLALRSIGIQAVSSTGGSGSFDPSWAELLKHNKVIICYDNDEAGWKGAFHTHSLLPNSTIAWLPKEVGEHGDITDYMRLLKKKLKLYELKDLFEQNHTYSLPKDFSEAKTKKEYNEIAKEYKEEIGKLMLEARLLREKYLSDAPVQVLIQMYVNKLNEISRAIKYFSTPRGQIDGDKLTRAKAVSIREYIRFTSDNTARCIWHDEKTPSMHYYEKQNRVKCFGCGKLGDVIDVVQHLKQCNLSEAIKIILNEKK